MRSSFLFLVAAACCVQHVSSFAIPITDSPVVSTLGGLGPPSVAQFAPVSARSRRSRKAKPRAKAAAMKQRQAPQSIEGAVRGFRTALAVTAAFLLLR